MIFCREKSIVLDAAAVSCQYREQHISKWNYEISVLHEIHISRLDLQRWTLEFVISYKQIPTFKETLVMSNMVFYI
jgi:hypothetical protein